MIRIRILPNRQLLCIYLEKEISLWLYYKPFTQKAQGFHSDPFKI